MRNLRLLAEAEAEELAFGVEGDGDRDAELRGPEREVALAVSADDHLVHGEFEADGRLHFDAGDVADDEPFAAAAYSEADFLVGESSETVARRHLSRDFAATGEAIAATRHAVRFAEGKGFDLRAHIARFLEKIGPLHGGTVRDRIIETLPDGSDRLS